LVRNIVEDASVTLSPIRYFVSVVECSSGLLQLKENAKKKCKKKRERKRKLGLGTIFKSPQLHG
jgi:hypothetical protein